jgi:CRISPR-associated endonuclease/helicase Cas3
MAREEFCVAELLAKPDTPLIAHLAEVTRLGDEIAQWLGLSERLRVKVLLACALHDIGKATNDFQEHIRGKCKIAYPHALASFPFAFVAESRLASSYDWAPTNLEATASVLTHHSPLGPTLYRGYEKPPDYHPDLPQVLREVWELLASYQFRGLPPFDEFWGSLQPFLQESPAALLDTPLPFNGEHRSLRGILQRLPTREFAQVKAVLHLADWLASAKQSQTSVLFLSGGKKTVEKHLQKLPRPLREFQRKARDASSKTDILWLRAPTGTGKTEALLSWAGDAERILYLLPTQATADAMWRRLQGIYGKEAVALTHGRASYMLRRESEEDPLDMRLFGSVFAKPITVATLDQYLLAHLHGRHWEERRTLAQRATVILDEIHAYEPYTLGLLQEALRRECPARMAMASATLPNGLLSLFPVGELIEAEESLWQRQRYRLELCDGTLLDNGIKVALQFAKQGKSVLVVANTVRDAQSLYRQLREEFCWTNSNLLHARFIFRDRLSKASKVDKPESGMIFVATQIVEVSLDISYDVLVTEAAPLDALVQRMGRVNRYAQKPPAPVVIFRNWSEGSRRIYGREILEWSIEILSGLPALPTDGDLAHATQCLYERVVETEEWQKELQEGQKTLDYLQRTLGCYTIDLADEEMRALFTARRGTLSVEVLPAQFVEEAYDLKEKGEGWRLPELLVPVPIYWLRQSEFFSYASDLGCIQTLLPYDADYGLQTPADQSQVPGGVFLD